MNVEPPKQSFLRRWGAPLACASALAWVLASDLPAYVLFVVCMIALLLFQAKLYELSNALVDEVRATDDHLAFVMRGEARTVPYEDVILVCEGGRPIWPFSFFPQHEEFVEYATLYLQGVTAKKSWEKISFELPLRLVQSSEHPTLANLRQRVADAKRRAKTG